MKPLRLLGSFLSKDIAVDLGNSNFCVYEKSRGIIMHEPSLVAIKNTAEDKRSVVALGRRAKAMRGRTPPGIEVISPMTGGVVSNYDVIQIIMRACFEAAYSRSFALFPRFILCAPIGVTQVERMALVDAASQVGARETYVLDEPFAGAIGASLPIMDPVPNMIVDIGGGTTEASIISLSGMVAFESTRVAGDEMDDCILQHIRRKYNLHIGQAEAEEVKIAIAAATPDFFDKKCLVRGRDQGSGLPVSVEVCTKEISEAISRPVSIILSTVLRVLEMCPPELSSGLLDCGIVLTGGGAQLPGLVELISRESNLPVRLIESPMTTVTRGLGRCLDYIHLYKDLMD